MANRPSMTRLRRGATALTAEAGKLIRDRALNAAHQALVLALQSVQAADRKLRGTVSSNGRRRTSRGRAATTKRKVGRPASKSRRIAGTVTPRRKTARRGRRAAR